jgi:DNA helicase-2/ATP-dependent DNA helicase PcrA
MQLNEEQTLAVEHPLDTPACLIAGAGSGKTRVLTERVRWLISQGVPARKICAITFTNKAAGELIERLGITDESSPEDCPRVSTIHSLCLAAIRRDPMGFGLQPRVSPLDDYDQFQMMKRIIERLKSEEELNAYAILKKIGFHRARGIGFVDEYTDEVHNKALIQYCGQHALRSIEVQLWGSYETEKRRNSVVDFDDMLHLVVRRGETDALWRGKLQKMFHHILVDESQDLSPVQWRLVELLLAPDNKNIMTVGDLSQSIYAFNGAVPRLLKEYSEGWRGHVPSLYRIARNHRSVPEIVRLANVLQSKMTETIPLKMESWRGLQGEKGTTKIVKATFPLDVALTFASEIYRDNQVKKNHISYKENCILVRSAMQIRDIETALSKFSIPYVIRGGRGLLQTEEVRDLLAYLRLATNPKDFMALVRAVSVPKRGVGEVALEKVRRVANETFEGDLIQASAAQPKLVMFAQDILKVQEFKDTPLDALDKIIAVTRYETYIQEKYKKDKDKVRNKLENIDKFKELIRVLIEGNQLTTEDLVFQLTIDRPKDDDESGSVTISTIHSAKGLEWKRVYVTNVFEGSLPHKFSMGSEEEIEEERRLFYVACTRPQDTLVLCVPAIQQVVVGKNQANVAVMPSRFLREVGIE